MQFKKKIIMKLLFVTHNSKDKTVEIAKNYTDKILILDNDLGRERSLKTAELREFKYFFQ